MSGWRQPPVPLRPAPRKCQHLGATLVQAFGLIGHPPGHEWECVCGQVFVVTTDGQRKRLVPRG